MSQVASLYISLAKSSPRKNERCRAIMECLPLVASSDRCLDIGTGHGGLAHHYSKRGNWTFLEPMPERLAVAREILQGVFSSEGALGFLAKSPCYSLVTCIDAIQYIDADVGRSTRAIFEKVLPGGHFLVSGENDNPHDLSMRLRKRLGIEAAIGRLVNPDEASMRSVLERAGFEVRKLVRYCGPPTMITQTILDRLSLRPGSTGDRLTEQASSETAGWKLVASRITRGLSTLSGVIDRALPWLPRYGWVLLAERPR